MTDELVVLAEGEIEIEIEGKSQQPQIGDEVFIPANAIHTVRNIGKTNNVWYYGYKR
jgi:quercetin dioxygenase-like cupin family protein